MQASPWMGPQFSSITTTHFTFQHISVYPGELFEVEAALVGDMDGTTNGVIQAKLLGDEVTLGDSLQNACEDDERGCVQGHARGGSSHLAFYLGKDGGRFNVKIFERILY